MDHESTLERLAETLEHLGRSWGSRRKAAAQAGCTTANAFTVALACEAGTQGDSIAQEVGRRLGWHVYDHELLEQIARDMGVRATLLESLDERRQSWLQETVEAFMSTPTKSDGGRLATESGYVHHLIKVVLALGVHGECVIVGRGAAFILPAPSTLRVRLVGPVPERIAALSRRHGISEKEAAQRIRTLDRERDEFVKDHFFKDPADPRNYDLVLNAFRLPVGHIAGMIVEELRRLEAHGIKPELDRPGPGATHAVALRGGPIVTRTEQEPANGGKS